MPVYYKGSGLCMNVGFMVLRAIISISFKNKEQNLRKKYGLFFRLVEKEDAEFIIELRTIDKLARFLHPTSKDISHQIAWIEKYKDREKAGTDYYYMFENEQKERIGVSRLYDIHEEDFTVGSWIFSPSATFGFSILGDIIAREIGFSDLGKQKCLFDVRKGNINVINYHKRYNPTKIGEDELNYYYEINQETFDKGKRIYLHLLNKKEEG